MLFFIVATYSELLITIPRFLTVFSVILISSAAWVVAKKLINRFANKGVIVFGYLLIFGVGYGLYELIDRLNVIINGTVHASFELILFSLVLTALTWIGFIFSFLRKPELEEEDRIEHDLFLRKTFPTVALFLFAVPALGGNYLRYLDVPSYNANFIEGIFVDDNAYGFSGKLISYLRAMPVGSTFAPADPTDSGLVTVFAPLRQLSNQANLVHMNEQTLWFREKRHPFFNLNEILARGDKTLHEAHEDIVSLLAVGKSEYILIRGKLYKSLSWYFEAYPQNYEAVFRNEKGQELILRILGSP